MEKKPPTINNDQPQSLMPQTAEKLILEQTPAKYIKTRPGPSGKPLSYVEVGYVVDRLNKAFGYAWDFKIIDKTIGKEQISVTGRLVVKFYHRDSNQWVEITKEQFGGIDIKFNRTSGKMVSVADDEKAAASDALKKCASMFGIAQDLYWMGGVEEEDEQPGRIVTPSQLKEESDGVIHEPTGQVTPDEDKPLYCETCGELASERRGVAKTGKAWHGIFCESGDKSHTKWIN